MVLFSIVVLKINGLNVFLHSERRPRDVGKIQRKSTIFGLARQRWYAMSDGVQSGVGKNLILVDKSKVKSKETRLINEMIGNLSTELITICFIIENL